MKFFIFLFVLFFSACSIKNDKSNSKSVLVNINSNSIKFSEQGFLYKNNKNIILEIYKLGKLFFVLKINDKICINQACYEKKVFNLKFFKKEYYDGILEDILNKKAIFNGKNLIKTNCGFEQKINDIDYKICDNELYFKDKNTRFIIKDVIF